jgi:hypothetical protein
MNNLQNIANKFQVEKLEERTEFYKPKNEIEVGWDEKDGWGAKWKITFKCKPMESDLPELDEVFTDFEKIGDNHWGYQKPVEVLGKDLFFYVKAN